MNLCYRRIGTGEPEGARKYETSHPQKREEGSSGHGVTSARCSLFPCVCAVICGENGMHGQSKSLRAPCSGHILLCTEDMKRHHPACSLRLLCCNCCCGRTCSWAARFARSRWHMAILMPCSEAAFLNPSRVPVLVSSSLKASSHSSAYSRELRKTERGKV